MTTGGSPAINDQLVCVDSVRPATSIGSVDLEVDKQIPYRPSQAQGRIDGSILKITVHSVHTDPVVSGISIAVAFGGDLDVMPGIRGPLLGIARDVGGAPVRMPARLIRVLPAPGISGALRAKDHCSAIRHDIVHIHFQICQLRWIDYVYIRVVYEVSRIFIRCEGDVIDLPRTVRVGHVELSGGIVRRLAGNGIDGGALRTARRPWIVSPLPPGRGIQVPG